MKHNLLIYNILFFALSISGCSAADTASDDSLEQIRFRLEYPGATKVSDEGFEGGDAVGLYMTEYADGKPSPLALSGNAVNNEALTFDGVSWTPERKLYWNIGTLYDAYGYFPSGTPSSVDEYPFHVAEDQSVSGAYESSDFLWAKAAGVRYPQTIGLKFSHRMSRVVISLLKGEGFEGDLPDNLSVRIHGVVADAFINLGTGSVICDGHSSKTTVVAKALSPDTYTAILVPQDITSRQPLVEIQYDGVSYLVEGRMIFRSGVQHRLNITLNSNPDKVRIEVGGEVGDWD